MRLPSSTEHGRTGQGPSQGKRRRLGVGGRFQARSTAKTPDLDSTTKPIISASTNYLKCHPGFVLKTKKQTWKGRREIRCAHVLIPEVPEACRKRLLESAFLL